MPGLRSFFRSQFSKLPIPSTSFAGKTVLVTGGNTGLGLEAARHFARLNAERLIITSRSASKGEAAKRLIETSTNRRDVCEVWNVDLSSFASVRAFGKRIDANLDRLDTVVLNAGIGTSTVQLFEERESTLTVNVLSTALMAFLLLPVLQRTSTATSSPANLTFVTSELYDVAPFKSWTSSDYILSCTQDALSNKNGGVRAQYINSKLFDLLLARHLSTIIPSSSVIINSVTPGLCKSEFYRPGNANFAERLTAALVMSLLARTAEVGSRNYLAAASMGTEAHGAYVRDCKIHELTDFIESKEGAEAARRLYEQIVATVGAAATST